MNHILRLSPTAALCKYQIAFYQIPNFRNIKAQLEQTPSKLLIAHLENFSLSTTLPHFILTTQTRFIPLSVPATQTQQLAFLARLLENYLQPILVEHFSRVDT